LAGGLIALALHSATLAAAENAKPKQETNESSIEYVALDAPAGTSRAVVVQGHALAHTRQLLPLNRDGALVGKGSVDKQIEQLLNNLDAVLKSSGSSLGQLVRVNVYSLAPSTVDRVREQLSKRLDSSVRPALTAVLTPLPHRDALVAVDAVAVAAEEGAEVALRRCGTVGLDPDFADAAVLPRGGVAYLSGVPGECGLTVSAVDASMTSLWKMLGDLKLSPTQVVNL
jgi:enamine deaminase RidA (YjgF/YER057c/UK114 family)